ncbi:MAG: hypothetical protein JWM32_1289 [Verrucomicrobia bacterium]|nr:hypothetical protein [Verrucomicrobiota bacterium]
MSRGLGNLQRDVLRVVDANVTSTTEETIRWELAKPGTSLEKTWTYAINRAVKSLAKRGHLTIHRRPLINLDEWLLHYPSKTHRSDVRQLRLDLLPDLVEWIRSQQGPRPLYTAAQNERFYARGDGATLNFRPLQKDRGRKFAGEWKALEPALRRLLANTDSDDLFYLILGGKISFTGSKIQSPFSFGELVDRCEQQSVLPALLRDELRSLADRFMPKEEIKALELKSVIYHFITSVIHGHGKLKDEALEVLYKRRRKYLEGIPGYNLPVAKKKGSIYFEDPPRGGTIERKSLLERLIDQTTFQKFRFVTRVATEPNR